MLLKSFVNFLGKEPQRNKNINEMMDNVSCHYVSHVDWVQSFTKKVIIALFVIYILFDIYGLIMSIALYLQAMDPSLVSSIISETNITFRDIVGAYILKSLGENISKGVGSIFEYVISHKYPKKDKTPEEIINEDDPLADADERTDILNDGEESDL